MSVISFAVIGKNRIPIYLQEFGTVDVYTSEMDLFGLSKATEVEGGNAKPNDSKTTKSISNSCSIRQQFILHDALDRVEQRLLQQPPPSTEPSNAKDAMFLGLLCPVDDMRVYGTCLSFHDILRSAISHFIFSVPDSVLDKATLQRRKLSYCWLWKMIRWPPQRFINE